MSTSWNELLRRFRCVRSPLTWYINFSFVHLQYITSYVCSQWWSLVIVRDNYSCLVRLHHYHGEDYCFCHYYYYSFFSSQTKFIGQTPNLYRYGRLLWWSLVIVHDNYSCLVILLFFFFPNEVCRTKAKPVQVWTPSGSKNTDPLSVTLTHFSRSQTHFCAKKPKIQIHITSSFMIGIRSNLVGMDSYMTPCWRPTFRWPWPTSGQTRNRPEIFCQRFGQI